MGGHTWQYMDLTSPFPDCDDQRGEIWRLWSYQMVHAGLSHLVGNMVMQLVFGIPLEMIHGHLKIGLLYQMGVVGGALACAACDSFKTVVGASGGVYTLYGIQTANVYLNWDDMKHGLVNRWVMSLLITTIMGYDLWTYNYFKKEGSSYSAHCGGYVTGCVLGLLILVNMVETRCEKIVKRVAYFVYVFGFLFCFGWYCAQWPIRPMKGLWYGDKHERPCCFQLQRCWDEIKPKDYDKIKCRVDMEDEENHDNMVEYSLWPKVETTSMGYVELKGCAWIEAYIEAYNDWELEQDDAYWGR